MPTRSIRAAAHAFLTLCAVLLTSVGAQPAHAQDGDEHWLTVFGEPGAETGARNATVAGNKLVVVLPGNGSFRLAEWDGTGWRIVEFANTTMGGVNDIAAIGTDIYVGGTFTSIDGENIANVARWDGSTWHALGEGVNGWVNVLTSDGQNLYVGGVFTEAGGSTARRVARWDGSTWSALTNGAGSSDGVNGGVTAIAISNSLVYVGGAFTEAGQQAATSVASWNPTTGEWGALGGGLIREFFPYAGINDLGVSGQMVYAAGGIDFGMNDGGAVDIGNVAVFDGTDWAPLGAGSDIEVEAMLVSPGGEVFASGFFGPGAPSQRIVVRWNGGAWEPLAPDEYGGLVLDMVWYDGGMVAFAHVDFHGSLRTNGIARWTGSDWAGLGLGLDGPILSFVEHEGSVYVGGRINHAGATPLRALARWEGDGWSQVGGGLPVNSQLLEVTAMASTSAGLVAGGNFTEIGGISVSYVALWDGSSWNDMGGGLNSPVNRLQEMDGVLYVGGGFFNSNGATVRGLARWTGSVWEAVGGGAQFVETFDALDGRIVVGSRQLELSTDYGPDGNGTPTVRENVVLWDGSEWSGVGGGVNGMVLALAFDGSDIIVGGSFTEAGTVPANNIARWDGSAWHALGDGLNDAVHAIQVNGPDIWVGGNFTDASGTAAAGVARWDGSAWNALGSGLNNQTIINTSPAQVRALVGTESGLFVGGSFTRAGAYLSENIAVWTNYDHMGVAVEEPAELPGAGLVLGGNYPNPFSRSTTIRFELESAAEISLEVFDVLGRRVSAPVPRKHVLAGAHTVQLDASSLSAGTYVYRLTAGTRAETGRFLVVR